MKIRTGFVSNSSSSSFLVCYKSNEDLKRFLPFNGAKDFLNDIKECSDKKALELLKDCLEGSRTYLEWDPVQIILKQVLQKNYFAVI